MPRKLPWLKGPNSARATRSTTQSHPRAKRRKLVEPSSDLEEANNITSLRQGSPNTRTSPPPALKQPAEVQMIEGFDHDDRFRMVEDEFLDTAKQFTQHLHAAEYQRMKKAARSQNAATINSISRPVTIEMPNETRRKVESVARARKQANTIQHLLGKQGRGSGSDEEFGENRSIWLGTSLHGLMESPRRSASSLGKIAKELVPTRAAAGFRKARPQRPGHSHASPLASPEMGISSTESAESATATSGESSDSNSNNLDAPIRARETQAVNLPITRQTGSKSLSVHEESRDNEIGTVSAPRIASQSEPRLSTMKQTPLEASKAARERIAKRLEHAKLRETRQQAEKLDIIPTFLS